MPPKQHCLIRACAVAITVASVVQLAAPAHTYNVTGVHDVLKAGRDNEPVVVVCRAKAVSSSCPLFEETRS